MVQKVARPVVDWTGKLLGLAIALSMMATLIAVPAYKYGTGRNLTIQVTDKERIVTSDGDGGTRSYYLVFTKDNDVLINTDSWWYLKFDSSSLQGELERGKTYTVKVYGWRIPLLSSYPNIVKVRN